MYGRLCLFSLITVVSWSEVAAGQSHARRARRRLSPSDGFAVYASEGQGIHSAHAKVAAEAGEPKYEHVELFRFVTPYRTGIEAMMDMTPYAPLVKAAVAANNLTMYTFVDSWVNNNTVTNILYMNNVSGKCFLKNTSEGNGWGLTAQLLFWSPNKKVNTQPRELVTLASGWYGAEYPIGRIAWHEANVTEGGRAILLKNKADFSSIRTATVYDIEWEEKGMASLLGYVAQRTTLLTRAGNTPQVDYLYEDVSQSLLFSGLASVNINHTHLATRKVFGKYNGTNLKWEPGMPVFFNSGDVYTDQYFGNGWWLNNSMPMKPVGKILVADGENVTIELDNHCVPDPVNKNLPNLLVPVDKNVMDRINATLQKVKAVGLAAAAPAPSPTQSSSDSDDFTVLLLKHARDARSGDTKSSPLLTQFLAPNGTDLVSADILADVDLAAASGGDSTENTWQRLLLKNPITSKKHMADGTKVAVITQEHHGRLMQRDFELASLEFGDRVILQLAVTGHGWASTAEQCGEYCHAVYRLTLNGKSAFNVTQFRDDCKDNPINGSVQYGTWDESRNGWCPGTVVPGLFMDMTDHTKKGANNISIDLVVWNNATSKYEPYTDYAGFVFNDHAELGVGMTAFIYNKSAVEAIRNQAEAFTAAEAALMKGCSVPWRLKPPAHVHEPLSQQVLLEMGSQAKPSRRHMNDFRLGSRSFPHFVDIQDVESSVLAEHKPESHKPRILRTEVQPGGQAHMHRHKEHHHEHRHAKVGVHDHSHHSLQQRFSFEKRAPWYLFNETAEDDFSEDKLDVTRVSLFESELMQGARRDVHVQVDPTKVPNEWSHVALHFHLHEPPGGLEIDHWDRVGSMGLRFG